MKKMRYLILLIIMMVVMPLSVNASSLTKGACYDKDGNEVKDMVNIDLIETGEKNWVRGNIDYIAVTGISTTFVAKSHIGESLSKVTYILYDESDNEMCKGDITGTDINHPSAKFKISFKSAEIRKIEICLVTDKNNDKCEREDIPDSEGSGVVIGSNGNTIGENGLDPDNITTSNICKEGKDSLADLINEYWGYVMVGAPILLIVMMIIDFLKAITGNDSDALKKSGNNAIKRVLATVILLMLPLVVSTVFKLFGIGEFLCF